MRADRYLKIILTIIAIELGWIAFTQTGTPVSAQQSATPVVITGIDLERSADYLPVSVLGQPRNVPGGLSGRFQPLDATVRNERAIAVLTQAPVDVRTVNALRIESDRSRPVWVENVGYTPARQPGE